MGMSSLTLQKTPAILGCIVTEIWPGQNTNLKSVFFFGQNFQNFWQNWILIFCCTTSVGMLFLEFFANFLHERFLEIWLGKKALQTNGRTDGRRTDGRTYTEGKTICLPQGETYNLCLSIYVFKNHTDYSNITDESKCQPICSGLYTYCKGLGCNPLITPIVLRGHP